MTVSQTVPLHRSRKKFSLEEEGPPNSTELIKYSSNTFYKRKGNEKFVAQETSKQQAHSVSR